MKRWVSRGRIAGREVLRLRSRAGWPMRCRQPRPGNLLPRRRTALVLVLNALGRAHAAVAGDSVYAMAGLLYPATILNAAGDSVGTIGTPPAGFRRVPELEPGALAFTAEEGPGAQTGNRIKRLIESFDLVTSMDIVDGNRLVLTVGRLNPAKPWFPFEPLDVSVEAYDRHTGQKLFENVRLPEDSKVLGGGRYLYVLLSPRIPPWRIAKYELFVPVALQP